MKWVARLWRSTSALVALVAMVFSVATLGIGVFIFLVTHEAFEEQLDHRIATETAALMTHAEHSVTRLAQEVERRESARSTASLEYLLLDDSGKRIAGAMIPDAPVRAGYEEFFHYRRDHRRGVAQALATRIGGGILVVAADREDLYSIDRTLGALFLGAFSAMLVMGIGSSVLIAAASRRRISGIETTARAIMAGDFTRRIPRDNSESEYDALAGVLNQMLERIGGLIENLRQVSSDVAHDLRTPLTRLYSNLDRAMTESDPAAKLRSIDAAREQAAELLEIFAAILRIAEIEGLGERLPRQAVDLSLLVEQMAESYRPNMEDSGHVLQVETEPGLTLDCDRRLLNQAIANLLDNSLRHTPAGTQILLSVQHSGDSVQVIVSDNGPGVAEAEAARLFQRFARTERSRSTPGHGLGLALVAAVVAAHGGTASIECVRGFRVVLGFPASHRP